jgi:2-keto-3-deoxy-L-rhamnonate aldolase RhmA
MRRFTYMNYGGTLEYTQALRDTVVMIMIEKHSAVERLDEILAVEGIDMIQWGPADYSMNIGRPGDKRHPDVSIVEKQVIEAALEAGVQPRAEISHPNEARYYTELGVRHFSLGVDLSILFDWWKDNGEVLRCVLSGQGLDDCS